jgi:hypothetical protein
LAAQVVGAAETDHESARLHHQLKEREIAEREGNPTGRELPQVCFLVGLIVRSSAFHQLHPTLQGNPRELKRIASRVFRALDQGAEGSSLRKTLAVPRQAGSMDQESTTIRAKSEGELTDVGFSFDQNRERQNAPP